MSERIAVSIQGGVADVKLNRAEKLNALDQAMFEALADTGRELARDRSLRSVVLSGEGRAFCAGLDFTGFMAMAGEGSAGSAVTDQNRRSLVARHEALFFPYKTSFFLRSSTWVSPPSIPPYSAMT